MTTLTLEGCFDQLENTELQGSNSKEVHNDQIKFNNGEGREKLYQLARKYRLI